MSRTEASDPLHGFQFHLRTEDDYLRFTDVEGESALPGEAGFQSITMPELSQEPSEYREGLHTYTRKFFGIPTVTDITCMRGVAKKDTTFFDWMMLGINGGAVRQDLTIFQWHRDGFGDLSKARQAKCYECLPMRVKPAADLEASTTEVSLAEMDIAIESFDLVDAS